MITTTLLRDAADVVVTTGRACEDTLRQRLHISPTAAERLMDELEFYGIVGPDNGNNPRVVLARVGQVDQLLGGAS